MTQIYLIRHGESQANVDKKLHLNLPDHEIALSSRGIEQAKEAAKQLRTRFSAMYGYSWSHMTLWNSPYRRTRDTAKIIYDTLIDKNEHGVNYHSNIICKENIFLCEQQFGIFDGLDDSEIEARFPAEYKTWNLCKRYNGKFWARYPMGESPFDAAIRIAQSFETFRQGTPHIIVAHGAVIKLFLMMWFGRPPEWFNDEKTIGNCGIHFIEYNGPDNSKEKVIFAGYKDGKLA